MTDWSQVRRAADPAAHDHAESREAVARRYWPIIYAFIRQTGRSDQDARDLTQGFLADVFFGRGLLEAASPHRGRFRTLLFNSIGNYLRDDHRRRTTSRRAPGDGRAVFHGPLTTVRDPRCPPEAAFASAWVAMVMTEAAERCRNDCLRGGHEAQWLCLVHRVLRPALEGAIPTTMRELQALTGLRSPSRVSHAIASAKRRFARHVLDSIGAAGDPNHAQEEIGELLRMLESSK